MQQETNAKKRTNYYTEFLVTSKTIPKHPTMVFANKYFEPTKCRAIFFTNPDIDDKCHFYFRFRDPIGRQQFREKHGPYAALKRELNFECLKDDQTFQKAAAEATYSKITSNWVVPEEFHNMRDEFIREYESVNEHDVDWLDESIERMP